MMPALREQYYPIFLLTIVRFVFCRLTNDCFNFENVALANDLAFYGYLTRSSRNGAM